MVEKEIETVEELKLDIDHKNFDEVIDRFDFILNKFNEIKVKDVDVKETHKGYHIRIYLKNTLALMYRALFQMFLGSDYKREVLNFRRFLDKKENYNILFESKFKGDELVSEEIPAPKMEDKLRSVVTQ